jgi:HK97 gp10 family phage protein
MSFRADITVDIDPEAVRAIRRAVKRAAAETAEWAKEDAKGWVPVDTGKLRASIDAGAFEDGDLIGFKVEATEHYAAYVELGTSKMPAQPFLQPAADGRRADFLRAVKAAIEEETRTRSEKNRASFLARVRGWFGFGKGD